MTQGISPAYRDAFVGRGDAMTDIGELLAAHRLVTLVGPGGVGKTRLVREVAETVRERYDDVWFVSLIERIESVEEAVASSLGVADREAVMHTLARGDGLLVLDNLEHVLGAAADWIGRALSAIPTLTIVATSREALAVRGEVRYEVAPLGRDAAVELYLERASRRGVQAPPEEVGELVDALGGVPLAVELAASRVLTMGPGALLQRLRSVGMDLLSSRDRDLPGRHRTVRAALDWSWELLEPAEQEAFARCGAFRGPFDLEAAEAVLGRRDVGLELDSLVAKSLVRSLDEGRRFELLEPVRLYAEERLATRDDAAEVFERHAAWYARLGWNGRIGRCPAHAYPNLLAAHERFAHDAVTVARLVRAAEFPLRIRRAMRELHDLADAGIWEALEGEPDSVENRWARAMLLRSRGGGALGVRRLDDAIRDLSEASTIADSLGDDELRAEVNSVLATALIEVGRVEEGQAAGWAALHAAERTGHDDLRVDARHRLALVEFVGNDWESALAQCRRAIDLAVECGDEIEAGRCYGTLGMMQTHISVSEVAHDAFAKAIELSERNGDDTWMAVSQLNLADLLMREGRLDEAEEYFRRGYDMATRVGDRQFESAALLGLGTLAARTGGNPRDLLHSAVDVLTGLDVFYERARAYTVLGAWELAQGHTTLADDLFRRCIERLEAVNEKQWLALCAGYRACSAAMVGDLEAMEEHFAVTSQEWDGTPLADDLRALRHVCDALAEGRAPSLTEEWRARIDEVHSKPASGVMWALDNHIARWFALRPLSDGPRATLVVEDGARRVVLPDGTEHDFSRRGPLRLMVLALAEAHNDDGVECLSSAALVEAGYPGERMTDESGKMRVYTAIRRLRKLGFSEYLLTRDEGYLLDPEIFVAVQ